MTSLNANRVLIFDTTLRDGEQTPGLRLSVRDKLQLAEIMDAMRIDVIEAGFPVASPNQFEGVQRIAEQTRQSVVCALARPVAKDIDACAEALSRARRSRIHIFVSTSSLHLKVEQKLEPGEAIEAIVAAVQHARTYTDDVELSASDATRADRAFLAECVAAAIDAGAGTITISDTVGYAYPTEYKALFDYLRRSVEGIDEVVLSTHCHDDLGLAVANSLAGVEGGARQIQCTVNGVGERAGNAALEEVVMALQVRQDALSCSTDVVSKRIGELSRRLASTTGFSVPPNKAIVGANAFTHESRIHKDAMSESAQAYQIMAPDDVGWLPK